MISNRIIFIFAVLTFAGISCMLRLNDNGNTMDSFSLSIEKGGIPDQMDIDDPTQIENINMLSEGSQFGVHYFNEITAEDAEN